MRKIIALLACLWALCAGATNITNYPVRTTFNAAYWFLLSDVTAQTNWNLPGNYVASTTDLNTSSNILWGFTTNVNFTNIYVTNLVVLSNAYFFSTNQFNTAYITNLYSSNTWIISLTVTNPITNLNLTANTIVKSDANKALASVANGTGALTNNNAGLFGWFNGFASIDQLNSTSNSILTTVTNNFMTNGAISIPLTNYCGVPDMSKEYGWTNITSGFTLPLPINLPSDGKHAPTFVWHIQGNGTPAQITEGVNEHVVPGSVMWVTNLTTFTFHIYGNQFTSLYAVPIY